MPPSPKPQHALGQAIRYLRAQRELSQEDLAKLAGYNETYVPQLEGGLRNPSWASVERIAGALGVKISELASVAEQIAEGHLDVPDTYRRPPRRGKR